MNNFEMPKIENVEFKPEKFKESNLYNKFSPYKSELLNLDSKEIWDKNLPLKIRRRLLLLKLGFNIDDTQLHIPQEKFDLDYIEELRKNCGWKNIGINTALSKEEKVGLGTPAVTLKPNDNNEMIAEKISSLGKLEKEDQLVVYQNLWSDKENIVGGNIDYFTNPNLIGKSKDEHIVIEMQKGVWPRSMSPKKENFVTIEKPPWQYSYMVKYPKNYQPTDIMLKSAHQDVSSFTQASNTKNSVATLFKMVNAKELVLEWQYYKEKLTILDFHFR